MEATLQNPIGQKIAERRKELGLSQQEIADAVGVARSSVTRWELDNYLPSLNPNQTKRLCNVLQFSLDDLADT